MELVVAPDGGIRCLYSEELDLTHFGALTIRRASHVEPDTAGNWWADLRPVSGPVIGPFRQRSLALEAEMNWLRSHWLLVPEAG